MPNWMRYMFMTCSMILIATGCALIFMGYPPINAYLAMGLAVVFAYIASDWPWFKRK